MLRLSQALRFGSAFGLVLLLMGCEPIQSVHPFWTAETLVVEPRLLGTWVSRGSPNESDVTLRFEWPKSGFSYAHAPQLYDVYLYCQRPVGEDKIFKGWSLAFRGWLIELDGSLFLDLAPEGLYKGNKREVASDETIFYSGVHTLYRVEIDRDTMKLEFLDDTWVETQVRENKFQIAHEVAENHWLLTASSEDLQHLIRKSVGDGAAFSGSMHFQRQK